MPLADPVGNSYDSAPDDSQYDDYYQSEEEIVSTSEYASPVPESAAAPISTTYGVPAAEPLSTDYSSAPAPAPTTAYGAPAAEPVTDYVDYGVTSYGDASSTAPISTSYGVPSADPINDDYEYDTLTDYEAEPNYGAPPPESYDQPIESVPATINYEAVPDYGAPVPDYGAPLDTAYGAPSAEPLEYDEEPLPTSNAGPSYQSTSVETTYGSPSAAAPTTPYGSPLDTA